MTSYEERLETVPSHPEQARSYPELLALWKEQRTREAPDPAELAAWDQRVMALLTTDERGYYLDERRLAGGTVAAGKVNRLAGILLGRHTPLAGTPARLPNPMPGAESAPQSEVPDDRRDDAADESTIRQD